MVLGAVCGCTVPPPGSAPSTEPPPGSVPSPPIASLATDYQSPTGTTFQMLATERDRFAQRVLCGLDPMGCVKGKGVGDYFYSFFRRQLADFGADNTVNVDARTGNDGLVSFTSCK